MTDNDKRQRGLDMMAQVYGWDVKDGPGDFFGYTVDHLFAEIWTRPGLTLRDRRLLLFGLLIGQGKDDVAGIQIDAALRLGEIDPDQLREIVIFLTHYAGWPTGAKLNMQAEKIIADQAKAAAKAAGQADAGHAAAGPADAGHAAARQADAGHVATGHADGEREPRADGD